MKIKGWVSFLLGLIGLLSILFVNHNDSKQLIRSLSLGLIIGGIVEFLVFLFENKKRIILLLKICWLTIIHESIRFSMSYQYIIKVKDKYLLVKNSNPNWNWYQHVGGKYKRLEETQILLQKFEAKEDIKMKTYELKKGDLAVFIPAKNAIKFINWFDTKKDREISHWREFYEELLGGKTGKQILSSENFPYINYRFLKSVRTPLKRTPIESGWKCWEILQYDVLELIPNSKQQKELEDLLDKGDNEYIKWASANLIDTLGHDNNDQSSKYKIGSHAKWVLNLKWSRI
jgi:hypothetical protein